MSRIFSRQLGTARHHKNPFFLLKSSEIERQGNLHAFYKILQIRFFLAHALYIASQAFISR